MVSAEELLKAYPHLDLTICETLVKLHESGRLQEFMEREYDPPPEPVLTPIKISNPVENECEETRAS